MIFSLIKGQNVSKVETEISNCNFFGIPLNSNFLCGPSKPLSLREANERDYYSPETFYHRELGNFLSTAIQLGNPSIINLLLSQSNSIDLGVSDTH